MKNLLKLLLILSCIYSCSTKKEEITGKYFNNYEKDKIHFVELKHDSTYIHYYADRDNQNSEKNIGIWKSIKKGNEMEIMLRSWVDYGYKNDPPCNNCTFFVKLKDGELIFNQDLPYEMNFSKPE